MPESTDPFSRRQRSWWADLPITRMQKLLVKQELAHLDHLQPLIAESETELYQLSQKEPWTSQVPFLLQLPGIGILTAMVLLSAIGDITRFASSKQLVGYSGLGAGIYASGQTMRTGSITKQGRSELRRVMVEAAWTAVEHSAHWKAQFQRLAVKKGHGKAIVAIARKLLVVVWHVLSKQVADQHANDTQVALKLLKWSHQLKAAGRGGLSASVFVRRELSRIGLGHAVQEVWRGKRRYVIPLPAPPAETVAS